MSEPTRIDTKVILDGLGLGRAVTKRLQERLAEMPPHYRRVRIGRLTVTWKRKEKK